MLDKQKRETFCEAIRKGCTYKAAASAVGVCEKTIYNWFRKGREATRKNDKYKQFLQCVKRAEHERQQFLLERVINASEKNWKAAAWILERRDNFRKDAVFDEIPERENDSDDVPATHIELFEAQAKDLRLAMSQAMASQSWQAYAALQRQYQSVVDQIRAIKAEQAETDALDAASDEHLRQEAVMAIISLPPVLRQEIIDELARYNNVLPFKK